MKTPGDLLFFVVAGLAIVTAIAVIAHPSPIRSALFLVGNFLCLAILYVTLNAQLLAALQVVVYAGAIMVLFLFVIMLLNLGGERARQDLLVGQKWVAPALALVLLAGVGWGLGKAMEQTKESPGKYAVGGVYDLEKPGVPAVPGARVEGHVGQIGTLLLRDYVYPFELTSVLLLVGLVGAVLLAKRRLPGEPERRGADRAASGARRGSA